ncbi:MAG: dTDP-4-dehydrorhamnose reductase [Rhodocyclaceae bacterium]|nr:dTDP-4-dehydrorhamnose reductase [Rhodocyclaceae bacterium]CAG0933453.1 dTDP-4-dehydrorhamnose reductase [Rhodocyclaceae bacterium]
MNILLTGKNGQVGWELARALLPLGNVAAFDHAGLDLADAAAVRRKLDEVRPDAIVNAAAYTAVDRAESEPELASAINAAAPALLAQEAARRGALLIHYSTDYVFDGAKAAPYVETDPTAPLGAYGRSKLAGEEGIRAAGCEHLIFRTSWVYGARGANFLRTILRLAAEREELRVVNDQIGAPTWARLIAEATAHALKQAMRERRDGAFRSGTYHLAAAGETSWHGFASAIVAGRGGLRVKAVTPIATADYPLPAPRPANSRLDTGAFRARFGLVLPDWRDCLPLCLEEIPQ